MSMEGVEEPQERRRRSAGARSVAAWLVVRNEMSILVYNISVLCELMVICCVLCKSVFVCAFILPKTDRVPCRQSKHGNSAVARIDSGLWDSLILSPSLIPSISVWPHIHQSLSHSDHVRRLE